MAALRSPMSAAILLLAAGTALAQRAGHDCCSMTSCPRDALYRTIDGSCNNLKQPCLGQAGTPLLRLLKPEYGDEFGAPRRSLLGKALPSTQTIATKLLPQEDHEFDTTHLFVIIGQLLSHDFALIDTNKITAEGPCCGKNPGGQCINIQVPKDDPFYRKFDVTCLPMTRTNTTTCDGGRPQQISVVTHFVDASFMYGSSEDTLQRLREGIGGRLKVRVVKNNEGRASEFPPNFNDSATRCGGKTPCYDSGDVRINQNPMLAALQTVWLREHNRVAGVLAGLNPHWDDEKVFQEARRVAVAEWQHVIYTQWLRWLLGEDQAAKLKPEGTTPSHEYSPDVDPRTANDVTTSAYRSLHSMVQGVFNIGRSGHRTDKLGDHFGNPGPVLEEDFGLLDTLTGLVYQKSQDQDRWMDDQLTQQLEPVQSERGQWGSNLIAVDVQRGRDHWLPAYIKYREYVGLGRATDFEDLLDSMSEGDVKRLKEVYENVADIDYYVGGLMERRKAFLLGPTFQPLIEDQFWRWRFGDRFFYDFVGFPHSFRTDQIEAIQRASMSRIMCDNVRGFSKVPKDPFIKIGFKGNEESYCNELPKVDLSLWKEVQDNGHRSDQHHGSQSRDRYESYSYPTTQSDDYYGSQSHGYYGSQPDGYYGSQSHGYYGSQPDGCYGSQSDGYYGSQSDGYYGPQSDGYFGSHSDGYYGSQSDGHYGSQSDEDQYYW